MRYIHLNGKRGKTEKYKKFSYKKLQMYVRFGHSCAIFNFVLGAQLEDCLKLFILDIISMCRNGE